MYYIRTCLQEIVLGIRPISYTWLPITHENLFHDLPGDQSTMLTGGC